MSNLHRNIWSRRKHSVQKNLCLGCAVRSISRYRRVQVNDDGHAVIVRRTKNLSDFLNLFLILKLYIGVAEMELQPVMQLRIFRATLDFRDCILLERIDAAKPY